MARLTFPAATAATDTRYRFDSAEGTDSPADIVTLRSAVAISGSIIVADSVGRLPSFRGPDGVAVLYRKKLNSAGDVLTTAAVHASQAPPASSGGGGSVSGDLGTAALLDVGTTPGTVAAGDDPRFTNARTPTAHASSHEVGGADELALAQDQITGLPAALDAKADLVDGRVPSGQIPPIQFGGEQAPSIVNSEAAMLALDVDQGAVAIRPDVNKTFILSTADPSDVDNWFEIIAPDDVTSVAGKTGTVSLVPADVTGLTAALAAKADTSALTGKANTDLANVTASTIRTQAGLGGAALLNVGTTAGTVTAGNDTRITGAAQRTGGNTFTGTQDFTSATVVGISSGGGSGTLPYTIVAATNAPTVWKNAATSTCDGTDDAAQINTAINALTTGNGGLGGTVILSPGTFTIGKLSPTDSGTTASNSDSAVQLRSDVNLVGQGIGVTVLKLRDNFTQGITGILRTYDSSSVDIARITVSDLTIDGNLANQPTGASPRHIGFYLGAAKQGGHWCQDILVERVEVKNCRSYAFDPHERSRRLTFRDCTAHDNGIMGSANTYELCCGITADWITDSVIEGSHFYRNSDHGIELVTDARRNIVRSNHVWGNGNIGIVLQRGTPDTITLGASIASTGTTSITTSGTAATLGSPANGVTGDPNMVIRIDSEEMRVTATSGSTMTVTRGAYGTTAATHSNGATASRVGWVDTVTGLVARSSDFNVVEGNRVRGNGAQGIKVGANRNEIVGNMLEFNCLTTAGIELDVAGTTTAPTFGGSRNHVADNRITTGAVDSTFRSGSANLATYAIGESNAACNYNTFHENHVEGTPTTGATRIQGANSVLVSAFDISPGGGTDDAITWSSGAYLDHVAADVASFGTYRDRPLQNIAVFPTHNTQAELANAWYLGSAYIPSGYTGDISLAMPMCSDGQTVSQDCSAQMTSLANTLNNYGNNRFLIRLGWEMNLNGWPWKVTDANLSTWRSRWTTYTDIFRSILGSQAVMVFNPNIGANQSGLTGAITQAFVDGKVDAAGPDCYDCYPPFTSSGNITTQLTRDQGLDWWASLCRSKGVKLCLPEWGVSSGTQWLGNCGNDNPLYVETMLTWMEANADIMSFDSYFNEDASYLESDIWPVAGCNNPLTSARYAELFAQP